MGLVPAQIGFMAATNSAGAARRGRKMTAAFSIDNAVIDGGEGSCGMEV